MIEKIKNFFRGTCPVCNEISFSAWGHYRDKMVEEDTEGVEGVHTKRLFEKRSKLELIDLYKETRIDRWKPEGGLIIGIGFITMIMIFMIIDAIGLGIIRTNPIGMMIYLIVIGILAFIIYFLVEKLLHMHAKHSGWLQVLEKLASKKQATIDEMAILSGEKDVLDILGHIDDDDNVSLIP